MKKDHTHKPWEQEQVTLHIIHWNLLPSSIIDKFEKENPNIKIYTELYSVDDYVKIMETKLVNGDLPDIMGAQENTFKKYVDENIYMDLTDEPLLDNYMDEAIYELKDFLMIIKFIPFQRMHFHLACGLIEIYLLRTIFPFQQLQMN